MNPAPYCRFRDCTKQVHGDTLFCTFHLGADNPTPPRSDGVALHSYGSMRAVERTIKQQPDHSDTTRYGVALAHTLTKWFGNEAKLVAKEALRVLEAMR